MSPHLHFSLYVQSFPLLSSMVATVRFWLTCTLGTRSTCGQSNNFQLC